MWLLDRKVLLPMVIVLLLPKDTRTKIKTWGTEDDSAEEGKQVKEQQMNYFYCSIAADE